MDSSWVPKLKPWRSRRPQKYEFSLRNGVRVYTRKELAEATLNFSTQSFLGKGGYGYVYKAVFPNSGTWAAVKVIRNGPSSGPHKRSFAAELATLGNLQHRNLVQFKGWCFTKRKLFLVYEYMPNKSLDTHLFPSPQSSSAYGDVLLWSTRCHIARGIAQGLVYLHDVAQVVHRDIKAGNVLLDSEFNAYISDFGLARILTFYPSGSFDAARYSSIFCDLTLGDGSLGYTAPECIGERAQPTPKSDVFSFGVVLFEILSAKEALNSHSGVFLVDWMHSLFVEDHLLEALDPRLANASVEIAEVLGLFNLGLQCTQQKAMHRPSMSQVLPRLLHLSEIKPPQIQQKDRSYKAIFNDSTKNSITPLPKEDVKLDAKVCSSLITTPRVFRWKDIVAATGNFRSQIATGFFSVVYIGTQASGQPVAVKVSKDTFGDLRLDFLRTELNFVGYIRHANIVTLVGWSSDPVSKRCALVYDYMPNGSLQDWLEDAERVLPWEVRFRIAKELGAALFHLHESCDVPIIHRDVNPGNVLLDSGFHVRLADLAFATNAEAHENFVGTTSYLDPEYCNTYVLTKYADVYAYGIVLLQLVTGVSSSSKFEFQHMLEWVRTHDDNKMLPVDIKLIGAHNELEVNLLLGLGLICSRPKSKNRPNMRRVLDILDFEVQLDSPLITHDQFQNPQLDLLVPR